MSIKDIYNIYIKGRNKEYDIRGIINNLPDNNTIAKETLEKLNNKTTRIIFDEDIKGNYYVFLNDTVYLSNKNSNKYNRLTVICHECIHSIQNKVLQLVNFIVSNIEIIAFILFLVLKLLNIFENKLLYTYIIIVVISIIPRFILEIHASFRSIEVTKNYISNKIGILEAEFVNKVVRAQVIMLLPIMLFSLCFWKIIRICIIAIL